MHWANLALFLTEAVVYFSVMTAFLHYRHIMGIGVFLTALGVMHFMETYLAAVFYVQLPFGVASPGSSILFAGKLMMILMLYMREDAAVVRQPIYGLFLGNILTVIMAQLIRFHETVAIVPGQAASTAFLDEMGVLMVWGTSLLYIDAIAIILFYEKLGRYLQRHIVLRFGICGVVILSLDQAGFYGALRLLFDAPIDVFYDGWKAKMAAVAVYSLLFAVYLWLTSAKGRFLIRRNIADVFNDLTFRERYEELLSRSGRDVLTGVSDRARMELDAPSIVLDCTEKRRPVSVIIVDIDHFKTVNDNFGHLQGDDMLRNFAAVLKQRVQPHGHLYRFGGEEFVVLLPAMTHETALGFAEELRNAVLAGLRRPDGTLLTVSIGVATGLEDGRLFLELLSEADARLYAAKNNGRDQVHGRYGMWVG